jgi:hypothetical protein
MSHEADVRETTNDGETSAEIEPRFAKVQKQSEVRTYFELWKASECALKAGLAEPKGVSWPFLSSLVLTAFSFEAYMNHVLANLRPSSWEEDKWLSWDRKCALLCDQLQLQPDYSKCPWQTVKMLHAFRNTLAHGVTSVEEKDLPRVHVDRVDESLGRPLLADWQNTVQNDSFAKRARDDVEAVMLMIYQASGDNKNHPFAFVRGSYRATIEG